MIISSLDDYVDAGTSRVIVTGTIRAREKRKFFCAKPAPVWRIIKFTPAARSTLLPYTIPSYDMTHLHHPLALR